MVARDRDRRMTRLAPPWQTLTMSVVSSALAGAAVGAIVGTIGHKLAESTVAAAITVLGILLATAALTRRARIVQYDRETPQALLSAGPTLWSLANGALLGLGFVSRLGFWTWYLVP